MFLPYISSLIFSDFLNKVSCVSIVITKVLGRNRHEGYKKPKMTNEEFIIEFQRVGLTETSKLMKEHEDIL